MKIILLTIFKVLITNMKLFCEYNLVRCLMRKTVWFEIWNHKCDWFLLLTRRKCEWKDPTIILFWDIIFSEISSFLIVGKSIPHESIPFRISLLVGRLQERVLHICSHKSYKLLYLSVKSLSPSIGLLKRYEIYFILNYLFLNLIYKY
jgi:hypothetical protein